MYLKAAETTPIINNTFGPGTDNKCVYVCSDGSRSLAKETRALKMSVVAGQWKVTMKNRVVIEADPFKTTWEVAKELKDNHFMVFQHLKWIGKVKRLNKWVPHELTAKKKKSHHFEMSSSLILCKTTNYLLIRLWSALTSEIYTTDDDQFSDLTKKKLQSTSQIQTCTKI